MANLQAPLLLQSLEQSRLEEEHAGSFAVSQRSFGCTCERWRGERRHEQGDEKQERKSFPFQAECAGWNIAEVFLFVWKESMLASKLRPN